MISGHKSGDNLTIMNTLYTYSRKNPDTGKYSPDQVTIVYKDNDTGKKGVEEITSPTYQYYLAKDDIALVTPEFFIEKDKVEMIEVPYSDLLKSIAEKTDNLPLFYENIKCNNRRANEQLHTHPRVFRSDSQIEDHYRMRFDKEYVNDICPITKSFLDIEVDLKKTITIDGVKKRVSAIMGDFPEPGECPINAISYISESTKEIYAFILRNPDNPLIEEFEKSIGPGVFNELKDLLKYTVGGSMKFKKFKLDQFEFKFVFYDDEVNLLGDLFGLINYQQPDFLLVWNMAFDMPFIIKRLQNLGIDPASVICPKAFKLKECEYYIDERNKNELAERGDFAKISSFTVYMDQMIQFASRRKGQSVRPSYSLNSIGGDIVGVRKLDYSHITTDIGELAYLDFKTFIFYNIIDTIVQYCIEFKTGDINYIFGKCILNNTRYQKGHRQTVYLANRAGKMFDEQGFIIGNNVNRNNSPIKFSGGLVGDPTLINDYSKRTINGRPINVYDNLDDYDYKSLYPSLAREFNTAPNTQIGKVVIEDKVHDKENPFNQEYYERGGDFLDNLQSGVYLEICSRWFGLASFMELFDDIKEFFEYKSIPRFDTSYLYKNEDGTSNPIHYMKELGLEYDPIIRLDMDKEKESIIDIANNQVSSSFKYNTIDISDIDYSKISIGGNPTCEF